MTDSETPRGDSYSYDGQRADTPGAESPPGGVPPYDPPNIGEPAQPFSAPLNQQHTQNFGQDAGSGGGFRPEGADDPAANQWSSPPPQGAQYGTQPNFGAPGYQQGTYAPPGQYGAPNQPQYGAPPISPQSEKNAGVLAHALGVISIFTAGLGGWIGPLFVYLLYKDRSPFATQESREALNFGILTAIATVGISVVVFFLTLISFGLLSILFALAWGPAIVQTIFSIIGALRVSDGGSYVYPFNWRLVRA